MLFRSADANAAQDAVNQFADTIDTITFENGPETALAEIDRVLDELRNGEDDIYYLWTDGDELTPGIRQALINRIEEMRIDHVLDYPPDEYKKGGRVTKYAKGGTVSQLPSLDAMRYELMMRSK